MGRDYSISIIRILSMLSIVACHFFQSQDMSIAFWLNIGVQIFLFMSGFLYGKKSITNTLEWLKKQFKKILLPYYIYISIIIIFYLIFAREYLSIWNVLSLFFNLQLVIQAPIGLGHFWFIPVILICYLLTPLLQKILKDNDKVGLKQCVILLIISGIFEVLFLQNFINTGICNVMCYILGYVISYMEVRETKIRNTLSWIIIALAIISNSMKIFILPDNYNILISVILKILIFNSHILLGSALFIIMLKLFKNISTKLSLKLKNILDIIDKFSFNIYITHHVFILGPLAIISITPNIVINIIIILCCTVISAYLLEHTTKLFKRR